MPAERVNLPPLDLGLLQTATADRRLPNLPCDHNQHLVAQPSLFISATHGGVYSCCAAAGPQGGRHMRSALIAVIIAAAAGVVGCSAAPAPAPSMPAPPASSG